MKDCSMSDAVAQPMLRGGIGIHTSVNPAIIIS